MDYRYDNSQAAFQIEQDNREIKLAEKRKDDDEIQRVISNKMKAEQKLKKWLQIVLEQKKSMHTYMIQYYLNLKKI